jgi:hypothetical protein
MPDPAIIADLLARAETAPLLSATTDMPSVEPVVEPVPEPKVEPTVEPAVEPKPEPKPEPEPAQKEGIQQRFSDMAAQRRAAEARADKLADLLQQSIEALNKVTVKPAEEPRPADQDRRPTRDDFGDPNQYDDELIAWSARQTAKLTMAEMEKRNAETRAADEKAKLDRDVEAQNATLAADWNTKRAKAIERHPDFVEVAETDLPVGVPVVHALIHSEDGPEIAYWLGHHPEELDRINKITSPIRVTMEIGRIYERMVAPSPSPRVEVSRVPEPIEPVRARNAAADKTPEEMTTDEYARWASTRPNNPIKLHAKILGSA